MSNTGSTFHAPPIAAASPPRWLDADQTGTRSTEPIVRRWQRGGDLAQILDGRRCGSGGHQRDRARHTAPAWQRSATGQLRDIAGRRNRQTHWQRSAAGRRSLWIAEDRFETRAAVARGSVADSHATAAEIRHLPTTSCPATNCRSSPSTKAASDSGM
jgi:hypothetical protein